MGSEVLFKEKESSLKSEIITGFERLESVIPTEPKGQIRPIVQIKSGGAMVNSEGIDVEFEIEFDDDIQANTAEITIYNITRATINCFRVKGEITVWAGYGPQDLAMIFSGYISEKKTLSEATDRVTTIKALDDLKREEQEVQSISYQANTKASYILRDLCGRVKLPIAVFKTPKDHVYTDEVTVDGDLYRAIKQYADVCGVAAYVCKQKIYVRPLSEGDNTRFKLSAGTGLLKVSEFEEENTILDKKETVKGFDIECLLQNRLQTASIIELDSINYKGTYRVKSGTHRYSGNDFITKARIV